MPLTAKLTEAAFTRQVVALAHFLGWKTARFRPAMTRKGWRTAVQGDGAGFPDLVLVRQGHAGQVIFAELKVGRGALTAAQQEWLGALRSVHVPVFLWRPEDWPEIERILEEGP